jgi:hypothetical protein
MATWNWKQGIGNVETAKQQAMEQIQNIVSVYFLHITKSELKFLKIFRIFLFYCFDDQKFNGG